ncbi:hypothetical protein AWH56_018100 [Anaerobacillus isosaccharinicus]|uniref:Uncharacterized protein n=1 Tax=Anaerobacillus isosaccharinicus TaxID=1532552 RepID=A0A7S7L543_9BACI|nr:hypothetical protein [Anaerobacillus isosaccharinicus]QOY34622.1 hypothetical protein AWH56_018100 [Anaerobacillus isosaccharinicus]
MKNFITIEMQYEKDRTQNGGVAEIIGFHDRYVFDRTWDDSPEIIKKADKNASGIKKYKLFEGKIYYIKYPYGRQKPKYVKIKNTQMVPLREMDVKKLLEEFLQPTQIFTKVQSQTTSLNNHENHLNPNVIFILENLDEAFAAKETNNGDSIFLGMSIVTYKFSVKENLKEEWVLIKDNLEHGKTVEEIKKLLVAKSMTEAKPTRVFNVEKYRAII